MGPLALPYTFQMLPSFLGARWHLDSEVTDAHLHFISSSFDFEIEGPGLISFVDLQPIGYCCRQMYSYWDRAQGSSCQNKRDSHIHFALVEGRGKAGITPGNFLRLTIRLKGENLWPHQSKLGGGHSWLSLSCRSIILFRSGLSIRCS